jgi:hypothetical protein
MVYHEASKRLTLDCSYPAIGVNLAAHVPHRRFASAL